MTGCMQEPPLMEHTVSVIIPCYNVQSYVAECLDSVLAQTFPADRMQIILTDDASTDKTRSILKRYEQRYPERILLIECTENGGPGTSRNAAMAYATGDWLMFVDADDTIDPEMLAALYDKAVTHDADIVHSGYRIHTEKGTTEVVQMSPAIYDTEDLAERKKLLITHGFRYGNAVWAKLYRTAFLREHGVSFPDYTRMEDIAFYQETLCTPARHVVTDDVFYNYRQNTSGVMLSADIVNRYMEVFHVQHDVYRRLHDAGLTGDIETEYGYIFYYKGFVTPMEYMVYGEDIIPYNAGHADLLARTLIGFFPDILHNPYVLSDRTKDNTDMLERLKTLVKEYADMSYLVDILVIQGKHGGFENILSQSASYLARNGCRVRFVQVLPTGVTWTPENTSFVCLDGDRNSFQPDVYADSYINLLKKEPVPDVILATGWPYTVYIAKRATSLCGIPVPVVFWGHGDMQFYEESQSGGMDILQYADICFAISNRIADSIHKAYPDKVLYRLNNTFDPSRVSYSDARDTKKIAYVGRLSQEKAVAILLYALELAPSWELYLVGDGEEEQELRDLAKKLRIGHRVHFPGWKENPWEDLKDCRALVMSSLYEGAPLTVLEALACGMQVVSTPCGFVPEVIREGETGFLYEFAKPEQLALALRKLEKQPYHPSVSALCRDSVTDYLPETALWDFLCKVVASARCTRLPQYYDGTEKELTIRKNA